jgi:hypothetical protein
MDKLYIIDNNVFINVLDKVRNKSIKFNIKHIFNLSIKHNMSKKEILKNLCNTLHNKIMSDENINNNTINSFVNIMNFVLHDTENEVDFLIKYFISKIKGLMINGEC